MKRPCYSNRDLVWCVGLLIAGSWFWSLTLYAFRQGLNFVVWMPILAMSCALLGAGFLAPFQSKQKGVIAGLTLGLLGVCLWMGVSEFMLVAMVLFVAFFVRPPAPQVQRDAINAVNPSFTDGVTNAAGLYAASSNQSPSTEPPPTSPPSA